MNTKVKTWVGTVIIIIIAVIAHAIKEKEFKECNKIRLLYSLNLIIF